VSYLERGCWDFKGNELGFWIFKRYCPIFVRVCWYPHFQQLWQLFLTCLATKGRMQNGTTPSFMGMSLKDGHTRGFINFLSVLAYIAFLDIWIFEFKYELWVHQIHFRIFGGKHLQVPWKCGNPETMSFLSAPSTLPHSAPTASLT
jgi:hypothetical protein